MAGLSDDALPMGYKAHMADGGDLDTRLRTAMFAHLSRVSNAHPDGVPSDVINSFVFGDRQFRLVVQPGIRKVCCARCGADDPHHVDTTR